VRLRLHTEEKEMVGFRRWIGALAVLALFVGRAAAQVSGGGGASGALTCYATVAVPPALRAEGMTENIGDIVVSCTGGSFLALGSAIPTANLVVSLGTNVTSRLLGIGGISNASEALLIIDEAGASVAKGGSLVPLVPGFGPDASQVFCGTPQVGADIGGCQQFANTVNGLPIAVSAAGGITHGANVFSGIVSGNQVTFNGIPFLPPVIAGTQRVFRITNVRANVSGLGGGGLAGTTQLLASVGFSGNTPATVIAAFIEASLSTVLRDAANTANLSSSGASFNQCSGLSAPSGVAILQYTESFGTAFKLRVQPTAVYNGQSGSPVQNVPGTIYNSESNFVYTGAAGNGFESGLVDYGTRLKATFNNIPAGVRIFVSTTNLAVNTASANTPAPAGNTSISSFAVLVSSEMAPDSNGLLPLLSPTTGVNGSPPVTGLTELSISAGSATAVWEVVNTNPNLKETFQFGVWTQYVNPALGTATVNLSYAPTPPAFGSLAGSAASGSLPLVRFADTSTARNLLNIGICQGGNPPQAVSVSPAAGSTSSQTFTFTFSDPDGWQDLDVVNVLINNFLDGRYGCYLAYSRPYNVLYLVNDAGTALLPGLVLNGSGSVSNSACTVTGAGSSTGVSGNTLTLTLNMSFGAGYAGNKVMYLAARDLEAGNSGWQALGTWGVPGAPPTGPAAGGVTPARSSGTGGGTFTFTFTDSNGWQDLGVMNVLINDALNGNGACYLAYSRVYNVLYLVNDAGNGLLPGLTLNGTGTLGNSQCAVTGPGSSVDGSGNTLTLTLNMSFPSSFAGNRVIYMAARSNGDVLNSGWQAVGSRTVQ